MKNDLTFNKTILVIFIILFNLLEGNTEKYVIKNFTPQEYKAGIQNIDFAQNRDMTIFVANNLGVLSFNGTNWKTHDLSTGKKKRALAYDENTNRLYVGSQGEFGYYYNEWKYNSLIDLLPESAPDFDEVWDVYVLNSKVYFCTFAAIYVYDGTSISVIINDNGLDRCFLSDGQLYAQNQFGRLFQVDQGELVEISINSPSNNIIAGIIQLDDGKLIFYNSGKVLYTSTYIDEYRFSELSVALQGTYVNHVLQISDTRLAISTQTSGIFIYDLRKDFVEKISIDEGLQSNACLRSFQDYSGNLWVGMQNGIAIIYINSPLRFINEEIDLQGSGYDAVEVEEGTYYSTSNGIYYLSNNSSQTQLIEGTEGPAYSFYKIGGKVYACHHSGLFKLRNGVAKRIATTDGLWNLKHLTSRPDYFIGGMYSGLNLFKKDMNGELTSIQKISGFDESSRFFEEDEDGTIWVGQYYKGLYQINLSADLKEAKVKEFKVVSDVPLDDQIILGKIDNELYVATKSGLFKIDKEIDTVSKTRMFDEVIGDQQIYLFKQDDKNNVHIIAKNLVGFFKQVSSKNYVFIPSSLYHLRYFLNNDLLNLSSYGDDVLYSANQGFISYSPEMEELIRVKQPLVISKVYSVTQDTTYFSRKPFEPNTGITEKLEIDYRDKVVQIEVESFEFKDTDNKQFRFYLKGLDENYGDWSSNNVKEYTNLREGNYELMVQARSYLGNITETVPLSFIVSPPFYRSMLAKVIYGISGLLALFVVSRMQKRKYTIKAIRLEEENNRMVAEEQYKHLEIKRQKEKELLELKDEKLKNELQHMNRLLAASTMNIVVKNEFINMIKEQLDDLKQQGENTDTKKALEKIIREIDTALRLKEDWEDFQYHFNNVHGDFLSRFREKFQDLTPNEQKLCAFLRLNLSTKEIANSMSISLRGVEVARYRLRKKLGLNKGENLSKFILEY